MKKTFVILACALAVNGAFAQTASQAPASAASSPATPAEKHEARIEQRIAYLHDQLKITPAQETQWKAFAGAMREDGETMGKLYEQRMKGIESETALDNMHEYAQLTQAHADGAKQLVAAFEPLYSSLSAEQKKLADTTFRENMGRHKHRGAPIPKMPKPSQQ
jgi:Spy/CpxP family protein refolding chaperone